MERYSAGGGLENPSVVCPFTVADPETSRGGGGGGGANSLINYFFS